MSKLRFKIFVYGFFNLPQVRVGAIGAGRTLTMFEISFFSLF